MEEMTIAELFNETKKMCPNDSMDKLLDATLSLWTGGIYDAVEEPHRIEARKKLLDKINNT